MITETRQAVVVGTGLAGLTVALSLAPLDTLVITKTETSLGGSTPKAQGGVAFPRDFDDEPVHIQDTLISGAGHTDPDSASFLVTQAPEARSWLESQGVVFDNDGRGNYYYGREGAHSARRILHVGADATGAGLAKVLVENLSTAAHVTVRPKTMAVRLVRGGLLTFEEGRGLVLILSPRIILAGGGLGQLFDATTAPVEATGDTIALALEAGLPVVDLEMIQYHPTALASRKPGTSSLSLLTEALRGEGALLVTADDPQGTNLRPLDTGHPLGSLGPRDVLSRAIFHRQSAGFPVWLDARALPDPARKFPTVTGLCAEVGLLPARDLLPVVPAVHYTMGGIATDLNGRTSRLGIWAVGEAARTGVHGANRLASNSLLECVVFGQAVARDALKNPGLGSAEQDATTEALSWAKGKVPEPEFAASLKPQIQHVVSQAAGPVRDAEGLSLGINRLKSLQGMWEKASAGGTLLEQLTFSQVRTILESRSMLTLGPAVLSQALARPRSLGAHHRSDEGV